MPSTSRKYVGRNCNLELLADGIEEYFQTHGYTTQTDRRGSTFVVQARKEGTLRTVVAADRSFTLTVQGEPNSFTVSFGIGKWLQNLSVAVLEGFAIGPAVFVAEVPISMWDYEIEREFWNYVEQQVELKV
ncbi:MAG: hypothetical protein JRM80_04450 [Nitrososphaerota archaeon]|nr:hypothetical protein [Nitrososphaerota archaeon]